MAVCDLSKLLNITPGSFDIPIQIIDLFLNDTPISIENAKIDFKNNDIGEVYKNIHKIKPSLIMIGIPEKSLNLVLSINENAKNKTNIELIGEMLTSLENDLKGVYLFLETELQKLKS
jgi:hypothetical protein